MRQPVIRSIFLINFLYITAFFLFQVCTTLFWEDHFGLDADHRGYAFTFLGVCTTVVQVLFQEAAQRCAWRSTSAGNGNVGMAVVLVAMGLVPSGLFLALEVPDLPDGIDERSRRSQFHFPAQHADGPTRARQGGRAVPELRVVGPCGGSACGHYALRCVLPAAVLPGQRAVAGECRLGHAHGERLALRAIRGTNALSSAWNATFVPLYLLEHPLLMDRRLLILWLTIFVDLLGFTLFIPVVPYFRGAGRG